MNQFGKSESYQKRAIEGAVAAKSRNGYDNERRQAGRPAGAQTKK